MMIGDYVRIKNGDIGKIKENDGELIKYCVGTLYGIDLDRNCLDREVLKSSPNIIDLVQVGDYVNGKKVIDTFTDYIFDYSEEFKVIRFSETDILHNVNHIKSIVTKEQFSQMEYKI